MAAMTVGENFQVQDNQFTKLITCYLKNYDVRYPKSRIPDDLVLQLFSSPRLHTMLMYRIEMSGYIMMEVAVQAKSRETGGGMLSSLEKLGLMETSGPTMEDVVALVCASPRLARLALQEGQGALSQQDVATTSFFCQNPPLNIAVDSNTDAWFSHM